jgi:hypothetical protein
MESQQSQLATPIVQQHTSVSRFGNPVPTIVVVWIAIWTLAMVIVISPGMCLSSSNYAFHDPGVWSAPHPRRRTHNPVLPTVTYGTHSIYFFVKWCATEPLFNALTHALSSERTSLCDVVVRSIQHHTYRQIFLQALTALLPRQEIHNGLTYHQDAVPPPCV